jgi:hypothetical protein
MMLAAARQRQHHEAEHGSRKETIYQNELKKLVDEQKEVMYAGDVEQRRDDLVAQRREFTKKTMAGRIRVNKVNGMGSALAVEKDRCRRKAEIKEQMRAKAVREMHLNLADPDRLPEPVATSPTNDIYYQRRREEAVKKQLRARMKANMDLGLDPTEKEEEREARKEAIKETLRTVVRSNVAQGLDPVAGIGKVVLPQFWAENPATKLKAFYEVVDASKIQTIPKMLDKYKGNEAKLFKILAKKHPAEAHLLSGGGTAGGVTATGSIVEGKGEAVRLSVMDAAATRRRLSSGRDLEQGV